MFAKVNNHRHLLLATRLTGACTALAATAADVQRCAGSDLHVAGAYTACNAKRLPQHAVPAPDALHSELAIQSLAQMLAEEQARQLREASHQHASTSGRDANMGTGNKPVQQNSRLQALRQRLQQEAAAGLLQLPKASSACSSNTVQTDGGLEQQPQQDWREMVQLAEQLQQQESAIGPAMLTDTFQRMHTYLRISLTERCNLRCLYCMPEEGVELTNNSRLLSTDEIVRLAELFVAAGVNKIRLTGGEPTLRSDLLQLVQRLSAIPGLQALAMTSNGLTLVKKLPELRAAGLTHLNISLDTLKADRFEFMTRRKGHSRVLQTIRTALNLGYDPVKVNVVVMRGQNDDEIADFVEMTRHDNVNVRFIEYMPFDGNVWSDSKMVSYEEMMQVITKAYPEGLERCQDPKGEVAKNFRVPGFQGSVSFITSMTKTFCSDCNRLRIMADGNLKVCLFGANEVGLLPALREGATDGQLGALIGAAVRRKRAAHAGMFELAKNPNRAMVKIGG